MTQVAREEKPELICVAVATFERPLLLAAALSAASKLTAPSYSTVEIIVVDNDRGESAREIVGAVRPNDIKIHYLGEPEKGLSNARNRALDFAISRKARWLAFFDDDAAPRPDWLVALVNVAREQELQFTGGPVVFGTLDAITPRQQKILDTIAASAARHAKRNHDRFAAGDSPKVSTQNWLGDIPWIEQKGLRFDPKFNQSGGEDSDFFERAKLAGAECGWAQKALIDETIPAARLTYTYQYRRQFNFGVLKGEAKMSSPWAIGILKVFSEAAFRYLWAIILLAVSPVAGAPVMWNAVRNFARASGLISGSMGRTGFDHIHGSESR